MGTILGIGGALIFGYGGYIVYQDQIVRNLGERGLTVGKLSIFIAYLSQLYGPLKNLSQLIRPVNCYLVVWVADDGRETDGDPTADAAAEGEPGHGIVRVRAEVFGRAGSRRAIEAEVARVCLPGAEGCSTGIRVQSWQELR